MSKILGKLNNENYAGVEGWEELHHWTTPHGEMGLYQNPTTAIGKEHIYLFVMSDKLQVVGDYSARAPRHALTMAESIASFAGAIKGST